MEKKTSSEDFNNYNGKKRKSKELTLLFFYGYV